MSLGWDHSAPGWLEAMGDTGDATRRYVMDAPMCAALPKAGHLLDVGCGEGRFCRMAQARGLTTTGVEPTAALRQTAEARDPQGTYIDAAAEALPFAARTFDAVAFYLSLIDIPDFRAAIREAARVLVAGGWLLVANLHSHMTARPRNWPGEGSHWVRRDGARLYLAADDMQDERSYVTAWSGIRIENHHRPLSAYMRAFLGAGLILRQFEDPPCTAPDPDLVADFHRMPWAFFMAWQKPEFE